MYPIVLAPQLHQIIQTQILELGLINSELIARKLKKQLTKCVNCAE